LLGKGRSSIVVALSGITTSITKRFSDSGFVQY
jgi:hypothetical protein